MCVCVCVCVCVCMCVCVCVYFGWEVVRLGHVERDTVFLCTVVPSYCHEESCKILAKNKHTNKQRLLLLL